MDAARICVRYLATSEWNDAGREILAWLVFRPEYIPHLLDPQLLSREEANRGAVVLAKGDPRFFARVLAFLETHGDDAELLKRGIELLEHIGDFNGLIPWLRTLSDHSDRTIRSKASKVICTLLPNKNVITRQLESADARVRANAIEALWHVRNPEAAGILELALSDTHHRVLANALVGLFHHQDERWIHGMTRLASHPSAISRAAAAWALGQTQDPRARAVLETLTKDPAPEVRKRSQCILSQSNTVPSSTTELHADAGQGA